MLQDFTAARGRDCSSACTCAEIRPKEPRLGERGILIICVSLEYPWALYSSGRFRADNLNKMKNLCSKTIGEKMKVRELSAMKAFAEVMNLILS